MHEESLTIALKHIFEHSIMISVFVFAMMMLIDYINVLTQGRAKEAISGGLFRQYLITSFLGATPGCLGAFMNVSLYVRGIISFGAITGGMIATCGDEAFVMLAVFPGKALLLFAILFILGVGFAYIVDKLAPILKIKPCEECELSAIHPKEDCRRLNLKEVFDNFKKISFTRFMLLSALFLSLYRYIFGPLGQKAWSWQRVTLIIVFLISGFIIATVSEHYLVEHIWNHIVKRHIWKIFLWSFGALLAVNMGLRFWNLDAFIKSHMLWVLLIAGLTAIIPESGPHLVFVMMFAKGIIPFSVLLASSIVQDGHGMLPLLSYSLKDSVMIKLFNLVIGLGLGSALYFAGL